MGTEGYFPGLNRPGREADHSPPSSAEIKNGGCTPPLPHSSSWRGAQLNKPRDKLTFTLPTHMSAGMRKLKEKRTLGTETPEKL
jgi:hypothetical protein